MLIDYLTQRFPYLDRDRWLAELRQDRLMLGGRLATSASVVHRGVELVWQRHHREPWVDDRIGVLHADADFLVVDKPPHLPMHADGPFVRATLIHLLRLRRQEPALCLVHRLDRETSGVCVVARTDAGRTALHAQFEAGDVEKQYHAVVRGTPAADFVVASPIGRARGSRVALRRAAGDDADAAQPARTDCFVERLSEGTALLRCVPHTGRTHQIRVHLASVGLPILGDKLYGRSDDEYLAFVHEVKRTGDARLVTGPGPDRQLLHASSVAFRHPRSGNRVCFTAALPPAFERWLAPPA